MSIEVDPLTAFVDVDVSGDVVEVEVVGQGEKGDPGGGAFDGDASDVPYTPATEGDWDPVPAQVAEALDELAGREVGGGAVDSVNGETGAVVLDAADVGAVDVAAVGASDGVAELDSGGKVPSAQLPSYVDDVVEAANFAALPGTGETGKIYVTLDDNLTFRWSGSAYVEISASLALGETSTTAYRGDRGKTAYDHSQATGNPHGAAVADITGLTSALDGKAAASHSHSGADITSGTVSTARLGTGAANASTFLRGDGSWVAPEVVHSQDFTQGFYVTGPGRTTASNVFHNLAVVGNQVWHPIWLAAGTYDRVAVCTTVAGTSTWRLGLDTATAGLRPGVNVLDAGVVDMSVTAGWLTLTVSFTVSVGGWFFARLKCETFTSAPTAYVADGVTTGENSFIPGWPTINPSLSLRQMCVLTATGAAAGPFGNPPAWGYQQSGARMYVRKAS